MRYVCRPEPDFLASFASLNAERFLVRTKIGWGAFFGQNRNAWGYFPIKMRGVCQSEPGFLAIVPGSVARRFSGRPEFPGGVFQSECEVFVCQNQNSSRRFPNLKRGVFLSQPKFLAIVCSLNATCSSVRTEFPGSSYQKNAGCVSVRTEIPGGISRFKCEVFVGHDQSPWRYFPI